MAPLRLGEITYDETGMRAPTSQRAGDESLLRQHLDDAAKTLADAALPDLEASPAVSADFERPAVVRPAAASVS